MRMPRLADKLDDRAIKDLFRRAEEIAELHSCLTSGRGDYLRLRMLQAMESPMTQSEIEEVKVASGVQEHSRHLNKLMKMGLVVANGSAVESNYSRTELGEQAVNAVREFHRNIGGDIARIVHSAALGPNSIRLFLRIYGDKKEPSHDSLDVRYTPTEVGKISLFLPRIIEGVSAIDKLSEAGLFVYGDDGYIYMPAVKARSFYRYLQELYEIVRANMRRDKRTPVRPYRPSIFILGPERNLSYLTHTRLSGPTNQRPLRSQSFLVL